MKKIGFVDQTFRDAPQSLWATRMTTASMLPVAERMDRIGFDSIDITGSVHFDVCVRFLKENPWERMRLLRQRIQRTPMRAWFRVSGYNVSDFHARDLIDLWIERLVANGFRDIQAFDGLNDIDNLLPVIVKAKSLGARGVGCITYSVSPVHTDELYLSTARDLVTKAGADTVMLKDAGGLLTVDRIRTLVPALKKILGKVPLEIHSHCMTGLAPLVYIEAVQAGADILHTSIAPLANGSAQPATQTMAHNLRTLGYGVCLDDQLIAEVSDHWTKVAKKEGKPLGTVQEYDAYHYQHQLPGGMSGNFRASLAQAGMAERYDEVLEECVRVRTDLGYPMAITPFSQMIGTQALLNVVQGERYKTVPDGVKKFALGYFGRLLAPVDPDILDRIIENGSPDIAVTHTPAEPMVPALRKKYPNMSDDERLLRHMYAGPQVDEMLAAPAIQQTYSYESPVIELVKNLIASGKRGRVCIRKDDMELEIVSRGGAVTQGATSGT